VPVEHVSYLPARAELLSLHLELAPLLRRSRSAHKHQFIYLSLRCWTSAFLIISPLQASFWIASCAVLQGLGPFLSPSCSGLHSIHKIMVWIALLISHIYPPEVVKSSFLKY
jgi:hypothetical protein